MALIHTDTQLLRYLHATFTIHRTSQVAGATGLLHGLFRALLLRSHTTRWFTGAGSCHLHTAAHLPPHYGHLRCDSAPVYLIRFLPAYRLSAGSRSSCAVGCCATRLPPHQFRFSPVLVPPLIAVILLVAKAAAITTCCALTRVQHAGVRHANIVRGYNALLRVHCWFTRIPR